MELFQWAQNPWGQEILVRISWNLLYAAAAVGVLFIVVHLVLRRRWIKEQARGDRPEAGRVVRHPLASRLFHWTMAAAMLVLLFTGFLPVVGIQFSWVTAHWIAGIVLIASVLFHVVHATFWQSLKNVWIGWADVKEWWREMVHSLKSSSPAPSKPGKYPVDHKLYHHVVSLAGLGVIATGILMMFRVETPFWARNPYLFGDSTWGLVYVVHGLSSVALVGLVITHIYFAILPEKRWITQSMIFGWISRGKYLEHHDTDRWPAAEAGAPAEATTGGSATVSEPS